MRGQKLNTVATVKSYKAKIATGTQDHICVYVCMRPGPPVAFVCLCMRSAPDHTCMHMSVYVCVSASWASCCMHVCAGLAGDPTQTNWFGSPASPLHCAVCMLLLLLSVVCLSVCLSPVRAAGRARVQRAGSLLEGEEPAAAAGCTDELVRGLAGRTNKRAYMKMHTHYTFNKSLRVNCLPSTV